ncbi:MAG TPA: NAD(P)H-binding protein [Longimicrobiales bacterium]|nr:NAD(P)H-binding protein [Longimicrobiales bacterium]
MGARVVVTGANGGVGRNLLSHAARGGDLEVVAVVRSERAASSLEGLPRGETRVVSYEDPDDLALAMEGAAAVVHLAGILIESRTATYERANVEATAAAVEACLRAGRPHLVLVSVLGAHAESPNRYLRSKGEGERLVERSGLDATIIRTPILLGPGTAGATALARVAATGKAKLLGGGRYVMRPLDLDDLSRAILGVCRSRPPGVHVHELAGPETVAYRDLVERAAAMTARGVSLDSVPVWLAKVGAAVRSRVRGGGVTPTVIDVITANEHVKLNADRDLGITLTPLSATLEKILPTGSLET